MTILNDAGSDYRLIFPVDDLIWEAEPKPTQETRLGGNVSLGVKVTQVPEENDHGMRVQSPDCGRRCDRNR